MTVDDLTADSDFKFVTRLQEAKARAEDIARHSRAQAGLETGDGTNHQALLDAAIETKLSDKQKKARNGKDSAFWLDLIQRQIAELQASIDHAEQTFMGQYGEDWREQFAVRILDPDVMPQRREGESLEDYRARVEQALIDEMLNPDGTIKDEYKDHPEYGQLAQWAQWKHDQQQAMALTDPTLSEAERAERVQAFTETASHQRITQGLSATNADSLEGRAVDAAQDGLEDAKSDHAAAATENSFLGQPG